MPSTSWEHKDIKEDPETFFKSILKADRAGCMMMCGSNEKTKVNGVVKWIRKALGNQETDDKSSQGVVLGHSYTILSVHEIFAHGRI